jgi:hypothetical protein
MSIDQNNKDKLQRQPVMLMEVLDLEMEIPVQEVVHLVLVLEEVLH